MSKAVSTYMALAELAQTKMPVKASVNVARNLKKLEVDYTIFQEERKKILDSMYSQVPGKPDTFIPNNEMEGPKALQELMDSEAETNLGTLLKVAVTDLGNIEVTPAVMMELDWMIT